MTKLNFTDFMQKYILKKDTMNKSDLQSVYNYPIDPRNSEMYSDRGFVKIDNVSQGGAHWTCFIVKDKKSLYFDSLGGQPGKFPPN